MYLVLLRLPTPMFRYTQDQCLYNTNTIVLYAFLEVFGQLKNPRYNLYTCIHMYTPSILRSTLLHVCTYMYLHNIAIQLAQNVCVYLVVTPSTIYMCALQAK